MACLIAACSGDPSFAPDLDANPADDAGDVTPDAGVLDDANVPLPDAPPEITDLAQMCGGTIPTTTLDWERCYHKRYCENLVHCTEQNLYASAQECIDKYDAVYGGALGFDIAERVRAVADGRATLDMGMFKSCLIELSTQRCSTAGTNAACPLRYTGTIANGLACYADIECAGPGATCEPKDCGPACCTGTCTPKKQLGETCNDFKECEPGLVCSLARKRCVSGDVGTPCDRSGCDASGWCNNGTCADDRPPGAQCASLLECGGETVCVGLNRPMGPPRCQRVTAAGDACDWFCLGNHYCDLTGGPGQGVCRALPRGGESCGNGAPCQGVTVVCLNGSCVARPGVGQPCTDGACQPGLFCTDQLGAANPTCRVPFSDGESGCKRDSHCVSYLCTGNQATAGQCLPRQSTCP